MTTATTTIDPVSNVWIVSDAKEDGGIVAVCSSLDIALGFCTSPLHYIAPTVMDMNLVDFNWSETAYPDLDDKGVVEIL